MVSLEQLSFGHFPGVAKVCVYYSTYCVLIKWGANIRSSLYKVVSTVACQQYAVIQPSVGQSICLTVQRAKHDVCVEFLLL